MHTLREEVGDAAFWKAINIYLNRHKFGNVESTDLKAAMEESSGRDLSWFFDQWVYMGGYPKLEVKPVWDQSSTTLRVTVTQIQKADTITPAAFRLPLDVEFTIGADKVAEKMNITKRAETFEFKLSARPVEMNIDPLERVPVKIIKALPLTN